jgi:hypothetical protein
LGTPKKGGLRSTLLVESITILKPPSSMSFPADFVIFLSVFPIQGTQADYTIPRTARNARGLLRQILRDQRMTVFAVGLPGIHPNKPHTSSKIFSLSHRLKMAWVHTAAISTKMIDLKPFSDGPNKLLVRKTMCIHQTITKPKSPITTIM